MTTGRSSPRAVRRHVATMAAASARDVGDRHRRVLGARPRTRRQPSRGRTPARRRSSPLRLRHRSVSPEASTAGMGRSAHDTPVASTPMRAVGIDLGAHVVWAVAAEDGRIVDGAAFGSDELDALAAWCGDAVVAIDAPGGAERGPPRRRPVAVGEVPAGPLRRGRPPPGGLRRPVRHGRRTVTPRGCEAGFAVFDALATSTPIEVYPHAVFCELLGGEPPTKHDAGRPPGPAVRVRSTSPPAPSCGATTGSTPPPPAWWPPTTPGPGAPDRLRRPRGWLGDVAAGPGRNADEPPRRRDQPVPAPARRQPRRLAAVGRRGVRRGPGSATCRCCCRSATRPATGATSWPTSPSRTTPPPR